MNISFKDEGIKVSIIGIEKATKEDIIISALIYKELKNIINGEEEEKDYD